MDIIDRFRSLYKEVYTCDKKDDHALALFVYRPLMRVLLTVILLVYPSVTPNLLSFLNLAVLLLGGLFVWQGHAGFAVACILLGFLFDCADGTLARLKGASSDLGLAGDFVADRIGLFFILTVVLLRYYDGSVVNAVYVFILVRAIYESLILFLESKGRKLAIYGPGSVEGASATGRKVRMGLGMDLVWTVLMVGIAFPYLLGWLFSILNGLHILGFLIIFFKLTVGDSGKKRGDDISSSSCEEGT